MHVKAFYDEPTFTLTYVVWDGDSKDAVVIDPVMDYDPKSSMTHAKSVHEVLDFVKQEGLKLHWTLETHAHADHLSGSQLIKKHLGTPVAIGEHIRAVQETFKSIFDLPADFPTDGSQFDRLLTDGEVLKAGTLAIETIHTPGHTPACLTFKIDDAIFTGDALFMDDYGTGRCDFPKGSAHDLYDSIRKLYALPDQTRIFVGHDYQPGGRDVKWETTIGASKKNNPQLKGDTSKAEFVKFRETRDATLAAPKLLLQSVQINVDAGRLPSSRKNGHRYLNIPLNIFGPADEYGEPIES